MKNIFAIMFLGLFVVMGLAHADILPQKGSKASAVVNGDAARILADSYQSTKVGPLSEEAVATTVHQGCQPVTHGSVQTTENKNSSSKVTITCAVYYCTGHRAICSLEEQY